MAVATALETPPFPDPVAPRTIDIASRGGQLILTWESNAPRAAGYRIEQLDAKLNTVRTADIDAWLGRRLSVSFPARAQANSFRIHAIAPDGSVAPDGRRFGVRPIDDEVPAALELDSRATNVMDQVRLLTQQGYTVGGPGFPLPAGAARWDRQNPFTFTCWVKLRSAEGMPFLLCRGTLPTPDLALYLENGRIHGTMTGIGIVCGGQPRENEWHMLSLVYTPEQLDLYLDTTWVGGNAAGGLPQRKVPSQWHETLPTAALETRGIIDRLAIYSAALTPQELSRLFEAGPPADE